MKAYYTTILTILLASISISAQSVNDFTLKDATSNSQVSLSDYSNKKAVVVIFTSNVCPYSVYYEGRITQLISDFEGKGIQFVLINAHQSDKESLEEMSNKINTWGLEVPYLSDKEHIAKSSLKASKSPEAFILLPKGSAFSVFYNGAIDNNPQVASDVKDSYLRNNINNLLNGKSATKGSRPIGCMIR